MSAELFTNDFAVSEISRSAPVTASRTPELGEMSLVLEIAPPPPEERLATAIATAAIYYNKCTARVSSIEQAADRTTLHVNMFSQEKHMLNNYASSFGDKMTAVLNARRETVLSVVGRLMSGEIIQNSPLAERRRRNR